MGISFKARERLRVMMQNIELADEIINALDAAANSATFDNALFDDCEPIFDCSGDDIDLLLEDE